MKLAIVRQKYTPFGGAERIVERAIDALVRRGVDITLIAREWQAHTVHPHRQCAPFFVGRTWRDLSFAYCVQRLISTGEFDLVQSHERIPGCHVFRAGDGVHAAWLHYRTSGKRRAGELSTSFFPYHRMVLAQEQAMLTNPALRRVICNSRMVAEELQEHYGLPENKLTVIYNGVDLQRFHPGLAGLHRKPLRAELGIPDSQPMMLFVGNGFARKGVPVLLEACVNMKQRDTCLVVVGEDRQRLALSRETSRLGLAGRVRFLGACRDVERYFAAADGFVLPSAYDPCPNAVLEAMACGLPTIVSSRSGAREWITEGVNGFVVPPDDPLVLAERLDQLCALGQPARQAARRAVEHLSLDAMSENLLALYDELLGNHDSPRLGAS
ncbi:MAG: glycosyltransferase family 4 protein [Pseudomonadota bacterium]